MFPQFSVPTEPNLNPNRTIWGSIELWGYKTAWEHRTVGPYNNEGTWSCETVQQGGNMEL